MAQVSVTIAGKHYRMACGDGEEAHLEGLAKVLDERINQLHSAFGEIGDMRLHVMAALTLVDELDEAKKRISTLEKEAETLRSAKGDGEQEAEATRPVVEGGGQRPSAERIARGINPRRRGSGSAATAA
jgi:cell division protein ZapA